jgi:hypothetical protein
LIDGGDITANGINGSGVGAGYAAFSQTSTVAELIISGGRVVAFGRNASGIGAGGSWNGGRSTVTSLSITGGRVTATGVSGAAIGHGHAFEGGKSQSESLHLLGPPVIDCRPGTGRRTVETGTLSVSGSPLVIGPRPPALNASIRSRDNSSLTLLYEETVTEWSENVTGLGGIFLQVGAIDFEVAANWTLCVGPPSNLQCFPFDSSRVRGFTLSVRGRICGGLRRAGALQNGRINNRRSDKRTRTEPDSITAKIDAADGVVVESCRVPIC